MAPRVVPAAISNPMPMLERTVTTVVVNPNLYGKNDDTQSGYIAPAMFPVVYRSGGIQRGQSRINGVVNLQIPNVANATCTLPDGGVAGQGKARCAGVVIDNHDRVETMSRNSAMCEIAVAVSGVVTLASCPEEISGLNLNQMLCMTMTTANTDNNNNVRYAPYGKRFARFGYVTVDDITNPNDLANNNLIPIGRLLNVTGANLIQVRRQPPLP